SPRSTRSAVSRYSCRFASDGFALTLPLERPFRDCAERGGACLAFDELTSPSITSPWAAHSRRSSMSWVKRPDDRVAESVASMRARFLAIFLTVFQSDHGSSFSRRYCVPPLRVERVCSDDLSTPAGRS